MVSTDGYTYLQVTEDTIHHTSMWPPHMVNNSVDVSVAVASFHGKDMFYFYLDQTR